MIFQLARNLYHNLKQAYQDFLADEEFYTDLRKILKHLREPYAAKKFYETSEWTHGQIFEYVERAGELPPDSTKLDPIETLASVKTSYDIS